MIFVGDDWADDHHDLWVMDESGQRLASGRVPEGWDGIAAMHAMIAPHVEDSDQVVIGIEATNGLWVQALSSAGYRVFGINPLSASRYRGRHSVSGAKSDTADAKMLVGSFAENSQLFLKAKFFYYEELLGRDRHEWLQTFKEGSFAIFRLTPEKYHYNHKH